MPQNTPTVIPSNSDLNTLIQQSIADAGGVPPVRSSEGQPQFQQPQQQRQAPPQSAAFPNNGAPQAPTPMTSAPPARNAQADWFAQMGNGEDPDAGMDFEPAPVQRQAAPQQQPQFRQPQQQAPRQVQQAPQQHQIPEMGEIDALLQDLPQPGVQAEPQQFQQPQQFQPQQQVPQAQPPAMDPQELQRRAIDELMGREYVIPEADARRLISEPETVLPRLAATVHVNAVRDIGRVVQQMLPVMIQQVVGNEIRAIRAESEFYGRYPALNRPEFKPFVEKGIQFARQNNPQGNREQIMSEGATFSAMLIKRSYRGPAPAQPQGRAPVAPHVPAAAYGGPPVPQNPYGNGPSDNIFTELGNDPDLFSF